MKPSRPGIPLVTVAIETEQDVVSARQKTRLLSGLLGFDNQDQVRLATAVSELARNIFQYATKGRIEFFFSLQPPQSLIARASDRGPGIDHLDDILAGTYKSSTGMGIGIVGTKKLMDQFEIKSCVEPGSVKNGSVKNGSVEQGGVEQGTVVTIGKIIDHQHNPITKNDLAEVTRKLVAAHPPGPLEVIQQENAALLDALDAVKASKVELAELNNELSETNRGMMTLYSELDEKAASLHRANEVKTKFLSTMTHELRAPLSSIISLTRILLDQSDGVLTGEQSKQVGYIRQASQGLLQLVNDLLDLAKVEAGKISVNVTEFPIEDIQIGLRGMFRPLLDQHKGVEFQSQTEGPDFNLKTDEAKLSQILRNLVSNALKFTEQGLVEVTAKLEPDDQVRFTVVDSGIGIDPQHLEEIFQDFSQLNSPQQAKHKGTGLGLSISRKLAHILGGDLWVQSEVGNGSMFTVTLPRIYQGVGEGTMVSHEADDKSAPVEVARQASNKVRILLIDDHEPARYILKNLLSEGIEATYMEAENGRRGLNFIRGWLPEVIFLDLNMPEMDGFEVLAALENDPEVKNLPVIINTDQELSSADLEFLQLRSVAILNKHRPDRDVATEELRQALHKVGVNWNLSYQLD